MKWKKYAWGLSLTMVVTLGIYGGMGAYQPLREKYIMNRLNVSKEKLKELRVLYQSVYNNVDKGTKFLGEGAHKMSTKITDEYYKKDSIAVHNDTIVIPEDFDIRHHAPIQYGMSSTKYPQIDVNYFLYTGQNKEVAAYVAEMNLERKMTLIHEMTHKEHQGDIYHVPVGQRERGIWAADELLAIVGEGLSDYAVFKGNSAGWDTAYETAVHTNDLEYVIPADKVQGAVDHAISKGVDRLSAMPVYRHFFIEYEGKGRLSWKDAFNPEERRGNMQDALKKMRSHFKINGKKVDIFSLASKEVRKRAEEFINDRDEDMRLVMFARDKNIEL